jgi:glycosyltransferase involved in cell wall biosynthesis
VKLAFVVQRYGPEIAGGSEAHCRAIAQQLAGRHDITVLTSCASDYVTWRNTYPADTSRDGLVSVIRFPVTRSRRLHAFADISDEVFDGAASRDRQEEWFRANGPEVPGLLDHLRQHGPSYDLVLFWTYRYFPSYFGVPIVADRAVLLPTAEEDRAIDLGVLAEYFTAPAGYLFLTPEEQALVASRAGAPLGPSSVIGMGLEPASAIADRALLDRGGIPAEYVLYLGRVDRNKGCQTLFDHFLFYADAIAADAVTLVLAGPATMRIPDHPRIKVLGYVSNEMRHALLAHADVLAVPSPYESLSIALLEGWNHGVPALVNARCAVLQGQVRRANGGLAYRSADEFVEMLSWLRTHPSERRALGTQGLRYVEREYRWPVVMARVQALLDDVLAGRTHGHRLRHGDHAGSGGGGA